MVAIGAAVFALAAPRGRSSSRQATEPQEQNSRSGALAAALAELAGLSPLHRGSYCPRTPISNKSFRRRRTRSLGGVLGGGT
eukprot:14946481-Alexandrium_andersonii.AAC.1